MRILGEIFETRDESEKLWGILQTGAGAGIFYGKSAKPSQKPVMNQEKGKAFRVALAICCKQNRRDFKGSVMFHV